MQGVHRLTGSWSRRTSAEAEHILDLLLSVILAATEHVRFVAFREAKFVNLSLNRAVRMINFNLDGALTIVPKVIKPTRA